MNSAEFLDAMLCRGYSRKTASHYVNTIRRFVVLCESQQVDLDAATPSEINRLSELVKPSGASRNLLRSSLRAYYQAIGRFDSPHLAVYVPTRPTMRCRALADADAARLAHFAAARDDEKGLAVLLGLYCGLRRGEIAALRWSDLSSDGWVTVTGKGRTRTIPMPAVVRDRWSRLYRGQNVNRFVFEGRWGGQPNPTTIWGWVRDVSREAGIDPVMTHVLRHTALAAALDASHDLRAVQELAGHADPNTTAGYTRVRADRLLAVSDGIRYGVAS